MGRGERLQREGREEEGEESKVEKPPLLFEAMTLSLVRSLLRRGGPPFILPSPTPIEPNDASFPRLRQTDRPNETTNTHRVPSH